MIITLGVPTQAKGIELLEQISQLLPQARSSLLDVQPNCKFLVINISNDALVTQEQSTLIQTLKQLQRNIV